MVPRPMRERACSSPPPHGVAARAYFQYESRSGDGLAGLACLADGGAGLDRVKVSTVTEAAAEAQTIAFINAHVSAKDRPVLAGNSIRQDRRFVRKYMTRVSFLGLRALC